MAYRQKGEHNFESEIQQEILLEFGSGKPLRLWRNNVGVAYPLSTIKEFVGRLWGAINKKPFNTKNIKDVLLAFRHTRPVRYSVVGSADTLGIVMIGGRGLAVEVKMPGEVLDPEQIKWRDMWIKFGGIHITAYCVEDVYVGLEKEGIHCR